MIESLLETLFRSIFRIPKADQNPETLAMKGSFTPEGHLRMTKPHYRLSFGSPRNWDSLHEFFKPSTTCVNTHNSFRP